MIILKENENNYLIIEKVAKEWWLELINRKSGTSQILYCKTRKIAENFFKDHQKRGEYLDFEKIKHYCDKFDLKPQKIYKENVDFETWKTI